MNRTIRPLVLPACLALCALLGVASAGASPGDGPAAPGPKETTKKIAPGLTYTKIVQKKLPRRTYILRVDLSKPLTLDTRLSEPALPAGAPLSRVVRRAHALAGINGDFGRSTPVHPFAQDGELLQTTDALGTLFAVTRNESRVFVGQPSVSVTLTVGPTGRVFTLDRWNQGDPMPGEIVGYSPLGGSMEFPPPFSCSARLLPSGPPELAETDGVRRDYVVDEVGCFQASMLREGGVVISAAPATDEATEILALEPGTSMRLRWSLGWAGVFDAIGGGPLLVQDGRIVGECNSGCGPAPRTGIGVTAGGKILLVVIDGRQPNWSLGPSAAEFAQIMRELGAVDALNLDGGGSSEMVVQGKVVNRPSDGQERSISNALVVLPGPDPDEP